MPRRKSEWWTFYADHKSFILRASQIDSALLKVVMILLRKRIIYAEHYLLFAEGPGEWQICDTMAKSVF